MGKNNNTNEQELQEAQRYFEWFKGLDPVEPGDFVRRGVIRRIEGNPQEALEDFNLAEQQGYRSYTLFSERAKVNNTLKYYSQAIADVNIAMTMHKPTDTLLAERAFAQIHLGHYQQALTDLNRAIEMVLGSPDSEEKPFITSLLDERAKVHFHLRQFDKAARDSRLAFAIIPTKERRSRKIEFETAANKGSARWLERDGYSVRIPEGKTFHPIDIPNHSRTSSGWQKREGYSVKVPPR